MINVRTGNRLFKSRIEHIIRAVQSYNKETGLLKISEIMNSYLNKDSLVLFIGGKRASDEKYFKFRQIVVDIDRAKAHVLCDAHNLPFEGESFEGVICQAVLEHVRDDKLVIKEIFRVLKPGGVVYVGIPFVQTYHYAPLDYRRYTISGLQEVMRDFEKVDDGVINSVCVSLVWVLRCFLKTLFDNKIAHRFVDLLINWIVSPAIMIAEPSLRRKKIGFIGAAAVYFIGRKRSCSEQQN